MLGPDRDAAAGRARRARGRVPRRRRAHARAAAGDRRRRRAPGGRRRARVPRRARRRLRPPVSARSAQVDGRAGTIFLDALLASFDGHVVLRTRVAGDDPHDVGTTARARSARQEGRALAPGGCRVTVYLVGAGPGDPGLLTAPRRGAAARGRRRRLRPARAARAARARRARRRARRRRQGAGRRCDDAGPDQRAARRRAARPGWRSCG